MTITKISEPKSWRAHVAVHPAAELFPRMSEDELRELADDIKKHGLCEPITLYEDPDHKLCVLDGVNRLDALELNGEVPFNVNTGEPTPRCHTQPWRRSFDPLVFVISKNIHRRHLTREQKRELIANVLKAKPDQSNRAIAKQVKADDKTVGAVRCDLESTAEIPQLEKTPGIDGKRRPARKVKQPAGKSRSKSRSGGGSGHKRLYEVQLRLLNRDWNNAGQLAKEFFVREHSTEISAIVASAP